MVNDMDKKGKIKKTFSSIQNAWKAFRSTYLFKLVRRFLSTVCSIILVILLIIGALMFYFNMKIKAYEKKGMEYTSPFGLYTIISGSMEPNVSVYDVVIAVDEDVSKLKVGDIITFISNWNVNFGLTVTHRIIGIDKTSTGEIQLRTKGDNNPTGDGGTVTQANLVGKVVGRIPQLGRLQFFLAKKIGWFLVVFIPSVIIIIVDVMKIFKLRVLKTQIDNVKPINELEKSENVQARNIKSPVKTVDEILSEKKVKEDENVDTVELPKVGEDGVIKENPVALPNEYENEYHSGKTEIINIVHADLDEDLKIENAIIPKVDEEISQSVDIEIPKLKQNNDDSDKDGDVPLPKRTELKPRK